MIDIVLATYNGEKFLRQQLESIVNSDNYDELVNRVIVTDDNSRDNTRSIVSDFFDSRVVFQPNPYQSGVSYNFINGLKFSNAEYVMFCDQDDVWLPSKIYKSYAEIKAMEKQKGKEFPIVCFSDLMITNETLEALEASFIKYHGITIPDRILFEKIVLNNIMPGCSSIINKKMVEHVNISKKYIDRWIMHDWWIMLIASKYGYISFIPESLMKYRQHDNNVVGYKKNMIFNKLIKFNSTLSDYKISLRHRIAQYNAFMIFYSEIEPSYLDSHYKDLRKSLSFILKYECTTKRKFLGVINYITNGFSND